MPEQDYVPPHVAALKELAQRVKTDGVLSAEVKAAFLKDIADADPSGLWALMKVIGLDGD